MTEPWEENSNLWRHPLDVVSSWRDASNINKQLLQYHADDSWWELLVQNKLTLLVSREYEHFIVALSHDGVEPVVTYFSVPHPSGMVYDDKKKCVYVASTRNPNQILTFEPTLSLVDREDCGGYDLKHSPLVPVRSCFLPGSMYIHDLSLIENSLYANAVAHNAVVRLHDDGSYQYAWWPNCVDQNKQPISSKNYIQLNSIGGSDSIESSYYSASSASIGSKRPGDVDYPVDKQGVIFSGKTREPLVSGLTRPHSVRVHQDRLWVDNSGYGEFGFCREGQFETVSQLGSWTRGLCFHKDIAFVGVSRVIPAYSHYAPGLDVDRSWCGIVAIDVKTGQTLSTLRWPSGNQIFSIEVVPQSVTLGFPYSSSQVTMDADHKSLFYSFETMSVTSRSNHDFAD